MLLQILKKDIIKRKGINTILFLFITLATIFLASSINNILVVSSAIDYYMDYANVPDVNVLIDSTENKTKIDEWLNQQQEKGIVSEYQYNYFLEIGDKAVTIYQNQKTKDFDNNGTSMFLSTMNVDYCKVYDLDGKEFTLKDREIAVSLSMMEKADLTVGDTLRIKSNGLEKEFVIKTATKDAAFGNEMVGMSRFILSQNDFNSLAKDTAKFGVYYINTTTNDFASKINNESFTGVLNTVDKDMYKMVYSFDMILAGLLILVGICLILIALLVLRFTIVFSLEEQYQEIGILKAIGLRDFAIKKLYLIKYLAIVVIGASIGTALSIPVSQTMLDSVNKNMIMASSKLNLFVVFLCAIAIILIVLLFCYFCTRKLNKVSAITAIRGGYTGERFSNTIGPSLAKRKSLAVAIHLGINDILSHSSRYAVLIITICFSFILITIPLNILNTMQSEEMVEKFYMDPSSSCYLNRIEQEGEAKYKTSKELLEGISLVKQELLDKGYTSKMTATPIYFFNYINIDTNKKVNLMTLQLLGKDGTFASYQEGKAPLLENEVAFSKDVMKENGWVVGDYVKVTYGQEEKTLLISGVYSDYMQLGKSARINAKLDCSKEFMFDYWGIMVDLDIEGSKKEISEKMQQEFPDYEWKTAQEMVDQNVGGIQDVLGDVMLPMTAMLCGIIMLIILLMEKLFITREKGEIAMLKSIGFRHSTIRNWQIIRMTMVAMIAMLISIPLSLISNQYMLKPIFAIMGADVTIQVVPLQVYIIYPGILVIGIIVATAIASRAVKSINIREMNNLE